MHGLDDVGGAAVGVHDDVAELLPLALTGEPLGAIQRGLLLLHVGLDAWVTFEFCCFYGNYLRATLGWVGTTVSLT